MSGLIGKKLGMSAVYTKDGVRIPVTVIQAGPCPVTAVRTLENNGYQAVQLGFEELPENRAKKLNKPESGFFNKLNTKAVRVLKEFRVSSAGEYSVGQVLDVSVFKEGDKIKVSGKSKGKGFQGVMVRHNFGGVGGTTHGQSDRLRAPGSIGASSYPSRVFKGQRMAGRTGHDNVTVRNLQVVQVMPETNLILVKGAIPGAVNSIVKLIKQ
ncbi:MAG: 50S ribosomal protein L3 [Ignavibacteriaceae bacterium]|nr:50S ribosomal protein L3 [Ignavibacteriaceae bacterium]NUM69818.1 50S ribosomal protein L3 [Ignavibacteriaceae bacterium]